VVEREGERRKQKGWDKGREEIVYGEMGEGGKETLPRVKE